MPHMPRVLRPAFAWWALAALVAAAAIVTAVDRAPATRAAAACAGYGYGYGYGPSQATLTLAMTPRRIKAGRSTTASGALTGANGCTFAGDTVEVQSRAVVDGVPTGSFKTVATRTTDANGQYSATFRLFHNRQFRAMTAATQDHTAATSNTAAVRVSTAIGLSVDRHRKCRVEFSGGTRPSKAHHNVSIRTSSSTLFVTATNGRGRYDATQKLTCGKRYRVHAHISSDSTNASGNSGRHSFRPHRH